MLNRHHLRDEAGQRNSRNKALSVVARDPGRRRDRLRLPAIARIRACGGQSRQAAAARSLRRSHDDRCSLPDANCVLVSFTPRLDPVPASERFSSAICFCFSAASVSSSAARCFPSPSSGIFRSSAAGRISCFWPGAVLFSWHACSRCSAAASNWSGWGMPLSPAGIEWPGWRPGAPVHGAPHPFSTGCAMLGSSRGGSVLRPA